MARHAAADAGEGDVHADRDTNEWDIEAALTVLIPACVDDDNSLDMAVAVSWLAAWAGTTPHVSCGARASAFDHMAACLLDEGAYFTG